MQVGEPPDAFWVGNLKHRDAEGNCVPSQMFPEESDDEEEADEPGVGEEE